jgi:hypothetical protein
MGDRLTTFLEVFQVKLDCFSNESQNFRFR